VVIKKSIANPLISPENNLEWITWAERGMEKGLKDGQKEGKNED
jgi:hypothetical protein